MENFDGVEKNTTEHDKFDQKKFSSLPDKLLMKIVGLPPQNDLDAMMMADKKFNCLTSDPVLWKKYPIHAKHVAHQYGFDILLSNCQSLAS